MSSLRQALGSPIVSTQSAERIGTADGFVVDVSAPRIRSVHLGGTKGSARFVAWERISSFGDDAIMVEAGDVAGEVADPAEERVAHGDGDILDKRVLTSAGDELGTVEDVEFDASSGTIETLTAGGASIDGKRLLGVGAYAVVIRADDET
jgi:uncharacterized protein YrrD